MVIEPAMNAMGLTELKEKHKEAIVTFIGGHVTFVTSSADGYRKSVMALNKYYYCLLLPLLQLCHSQCLYGLFCPHFSVITADTQYWILEGGNLLI